MRARPGVGPGRDGGIGAATTSTFVYPGAIHVAEPPGTMVTIVGSCVAVCLRTPSGSFGGMVHFLMPDGPGNSSTRLGYANHAIAELVARIAKHARSEGPLEASLAGGALVQGAAAGRRRRLGEENVAAARRTLARHDVTIVAEAVGGRYGRRVAYELEQGRMSVEELGAVGDEQ